MARLVVTDRTGERTVELEKDQYVVGRASESTIQIRDQMASRRHCQVEREGSGWKVVDLGSSNGILVNGETVNQHTLAPGDEIQIGDARLRFEDERKEAGASKKNRTTTRKRAAAPKRDKSDSKGDDESEDKRKTTRRRRGLRRSQGLPTPVVVGMVALGAIVLAAVIAKFVPDDDPDLVNRQTLAEAERLLEKGDLKKAEAQLDLVQNPGPKVREERERLKGEIRQLRLEKEAADRWAGVDALKEATKAEVDKKIESVKGFLAAYPDSSYAGTARTALSRLESAGLEGPRSDPMAEARARAATLMERWRFGEAEKVWSEFREAHPLRSREADEERSKVQERAEAEFGRLVEDARRKKAEGEEAEARRVLERIVSDFGISRHVDSARRLLREEFE